jgi:dipeptidase
MKPTILLAILMMAFGLSSNAQDHMTESCTSIMVGRLASTDGSVITSHTCDARYRTWMTMTPARDYERDTVTAVYRERFHTASPTDVTGMVQTGTIPQVRHTYRFLDTAYPCLNEKQLAMGETTISGRDTLRNREGIFMIEELARIALERCTTARDAICLMGELVKKYGYGDSGECLTIADKNEVWIFEIFGEGPKKVGGVWAAVRIPDDEIAVSANISRIGQLDLSDPDRYMASDNVFDVARKLKLWDGKEPFCFWKAYSGANYLKQVKNYSTRELYIMQQLAPSLGLNDSIENLPVSVKPDHKVSVQDVSRLLGSYYEGTELDLSARHKIPNPKRKDKQGNIVENEPDSIVSPVANPWITSEQLAMYYAMGDSSMKWTRTVSVPWCSYSTVIQLRSWLPDEIGGVCWMAFDNPGQSPRFPIFCGNTDLPASVKLCGHSAENDATALWQFRKANRLASLRWGVYRKTLEPARDHFLDKGITELPIVEKTWQELNATDTQKAAQYLNDYTTDALGAAAYRWQMMAHSFWLQSWKGF